MSLKENSLHISNILLRRSSSLGKKEEDEARLGGFLGPCQLAIEQRISVAVVHRGALAPPWPCSPAADSVRLLGHHESRAFCRYGDKADGAAANDATPDGWSSDGPKSAGPTTYDASSDGSTYDDAAADGATTNGTTTNGTTPNGTATDGTTTNGTATDGTAPDGSPATGSGPDSAIHQRSTNSAGLATDVPSGVKSVTYLTNVRTVCVVLHPGGLNLSARRELTFYASLTQLHLVRPNLSMEEAFRVASEYEKKEFLGSPDQVRLEGAEKVWSAWIR